MLTFVKTIFGREFGRYVRRSVVTPIIHLSNRFFLFILSQITFVLEVASCSLKFCYNRWSTGHFCVSWLTPACRVGNYSRRRCLKCSKDSLNLFSNSFEDVLKLSLRPDHLHPLVTKVLKGRSNVNLFGTFGHTIEDHVNETVCSRPS